MKIWTNFKGWLPGLLIVALLCGLIGSTYAKYVKQDSLKGSATIRAGLGKIELLEHEAIRQDDGSYTLDENSEVVANSYILLPGLDIPKDPFVRITEKSPIRAYVYVEVLNTLSGSALTFEVDAYNSTDNPGGNWIELTGITGKKGGKLYVYTGGTGTALAVTNETQNVDVIPILNGDVKVGQKLNSKDTTDLGLHFYAYMYEVASVEKNASQSDIDHAISVYSQNNP